MATRSIVAEPYGDGWNGRYVHWDGHPQTRLTQLQLLVAKYGVEEVRDTIIREHFSWSSIDTATKGLSAHDDKSRFAFVEGYGIAHTDIDLSEADNWLFRHTDKDFAGTEYLYILADKAIIVCEYDYSEKQWKPISVEAYGYAELFQ
jgi:hypothetical protein